VLSYDGYCTSAEQKTISSRTILPLLPILESNYNQDLI
jgi:hypothetical protein